MLPKGSINLLMLSLTILSTSGESNNDNLSRFHVKKDENRRWLDGISASLSRRDPGFDPDVLNRFLEEYANKIKRTTTVSYEDDIKIQTDSQNVEIDNNGKNNTQTIDDFHDEQSTLNDTIKRHKFYNTNSHNDDRNTGWVTLDAIPWSKSKISKWQANPTTQGPWPDSKPWDKPNYNKPWSSDFPSRPPSYENNKPWPNKATKPHWTSDNSPSSSNKPWYTQERPRPHQDRPSYPPNDKYEDDPNQAQKWPPERPSWERPYDSSRPSSDIITDNGPPNFPSSNWDRPGQRPSYTHHTESYISESGGWHDRNDFPGSTGNKYTNRPGHHDDGYHDRPHFSHYQYPSSKDRPSSHPSNGDGQWVLLSTNRGYSKSRQRSIKLDALANGPNVKDNAGSRKKQEVDEEDTVPAVTSKRQIRLTVLPSINGTNTTMSHGGLLEVERTFKTVDQSQKEYEMKKISNVDVKSTTIRTPLVGSLLLNRRPTRNGITNGNTAASSSAVLAAVGAGMLPATMAMMIPMMLGKRKKRSMRIERPSLDVSYISLPRKLVDEEVRRRII